MRTGLDLVDVERLRRALDRHPGLWDRVFTSAEAEYCRGKADPVRSLDESQKWSKLYEDTVTKKAGR